MGWFEICLCVLLFTGYMWIVSLFVLSVLYGLILFVKFTVGADSGGSFADYIARKHWNVVWITSILIGVLSFPTLYTAYHHGYLDDFLVQPKIERIDLDALPQSDAERINFEEEKS